VNHDRRNGVTLLALDRSVKDGSLPGSESVKGLIIAMALDFQSVLG
jgi:hypothetical protein